MDEDTPLIEILSKMTGRSIEEIFEAAQKASLETEEFKTPFGTFVIIKHKKFNDLGKESRNETRAIKKSS